MSLTILNTPVQEEAMVKFTVSFTNSAGASVTPDTVTWTLTKPDGSVVNSREDVDETPGTTVDIILSGDDLALDGGADREVRYLSVVAVDGTETNRKVFTFTIQNDFTLPVNEVPAP